MSETEIKVEYLKEKIKFCTEVIKIVTAVFFTISVGIVTTLLAGIQKDEFKVFMVGVGFLVNALLIFAILSLFFYTFYLINKLKK